MAQAVKGLALIIAASVALTGCARLGLGGNGQQAQPAAEEEPQGTRLRDLLLPQPDNSQVGAVNKYIWNAALEVLNFLPVEAIDPFTGVIVTGYGTPPGSSRSYRATIHVTDPALEARSLSLSLMTRSGAVDADTVRAVEDAILTRARQLRGRDAGI